MNASNQNGSLKSRIDDMIASLSKRALCFTRFLDEGELIEAQNAAKGEECYYGSFGGYAEAERKIFAVCSYAEPNPDDYPATALCFALNDKVQISHRDVLGALTSLGIKCEYIGDIVITDKQCVFFVYETVAPLVLSDLTRVGRLGVSVRAYDGAFEYERKFETVSCIVSSMRIDCVVSAVLHLSREASERAIQSHSVKINGVECEKKDMQTDTGDTLSVRRFGKFKIGDIEGNTKKGKIKLTVYKYI